MSNVRAGRRGCCCLLLSCTAMFATAAEPNTASVDQLADVVPPPTFLAAWGEEGTAEGQFQAPIGIAINAADEVFITDANSKCVQQFTCDGKFIGKITTGAFPGGIAVDREGLIYVAAMLDYKISVYRRLPPAPAETPTAAVYELVREWGKKGTGDGEFDQPGGLAFGLDGALIVCDQVNHRVQRFTREGKFLDKWGQYGDQPGEFGAPERPGNRVGGPCLVAVDRDGTIYTTEPTAGRIQRFSPTGKYLGSWGNNEARDGGFGGGEKLQGPIALAIDRDNRVWVSATNHRVQLFTTDGRYLTGIGTTATPGSDPGQFRIPHGMAFDSQAILYVVDTQNHRVQKFKFAAAATP